MSIVSYLCFLILSILIISFFKKDTDVFSPARLFLIVWTLAIGLTDLKLSRFQKQWSIYSWILMILPILSVLVGIFIVYVIYYDKPVKKIISIREIIRNEALNSRLLFQLIIFLFITYLVSYIVTYLVVGYITIFTSKPDLARADWNLFGFGLFVQSLPAILYLIVLYIALVGGCRPKKIILSLIYLTSFITYFFLLQRYNLVFSIFISIIFLYYGTYKLKPRNILFAVSTLAMLFYWISSIRFSRYAANFIYYLSRMKFSVKYAFFTEPYMYMIMNLENFAHGVTKVRNHTFGIQTFDFILAITGIKHPLHQYLNIPQYPNLISHSYNTYTMFFIYYWDYGIIGLGIIPLLLGMLFAFLYHNMRKNPNINTVSLYCIFVFVIMFSFFVPVVSFLFFVFNLFVIFFVTKIVMVTRKETV